MAKIKYLTIHCAATPEGRNDGPAQIRSWHNGKNVYHKVITLDGVVHTTLPDTALGEHTRKANTGNVGVCYIGGCDTKMQPKDTRTPQQRAALKQTVLDYKAKYPGIIVRGHRDWPNVAKACPSFDVQKWMKDEGI